MTPLHFTTGNRVLATALHAVGFKLLTVFNVYDDATLERLGCRNVREAHDRGKPGVLSYVFAQSEDLHRALQAWDETQEQLKNGTIARTTEQEDDIRIACAVLKHAPGFREIWKQFPGAYLHRHSGETRREKNSDNSVTETHPGFIIAGEGISEEKAKGLGL